MTQTATIQFDAGPLASALESALALIERGPNSVDRAADLLDFLKRLLLDDDACATTVTDEGVVRLNPSERLLRFVAALRAGYWELAVIECGHTETSGGAASITPEREYEAEDDAAKKRGVR